MKTVFYAWQADTNPKANRNLIEKALEKAIKKFNEGAEDASSHYQLDKDTLNEPGSPDIVETILRKIRGSNLVVADITPVCHGPNGKAMPNSNVLFEAGYSVGNHGFSRTLLIANEVGGKLESLPFDIKNKRILKYTLSGHEIEPEKQMDTIKALSSSVLKTLKLIEKLPPKQSPDDDRETDAQVKRARDLIKLKRFLNNVPIKQIQRHVSLGRENMAMDYDTFIALYNMQAVQTFQGFLLYDKELRDRIEALVGTFDYSLSFGLNFHHAHGIIYHFRESDDVKYRDYMKALDKLESALSEFLDYVHDNYVEIDIEEYNEVAWRAFVTEVQEMYEERTIKGESDPRE